MKNIKYNIIRSKRKTIAIYITKDASVDIKAPLGISNTEIETIILKKKEWIENQLKVRNQLNEQKQNFKLNYGDIVLYQGKNYYIKAKEGNIVGFDGECFYMPDNLNSDQIKHATIQIYKLLAKNILTKKVHEFSDIMSLVPIAVKINSAKTRWGSCSGKNSINFSWRLILASDDVIDYVVIHELAHIKEHNHSDRFWTIVSEMMPDYNQREEKLKKLQILLSKENWE
ncbi:MAG: M48 family metallopeptidase [Eubacteriales bacterium]